MLQNETAVLSGENSAGSDKKISGGEVELSLVAGGQQPLFDIARGLTHKLRNPLSVIMTAGSQMVEDDDERLSPEDRSMINLILQAADRLEAILSRFAIYACPEEPSPIETCLNEICRQAISEQQAATRERQVTITLDDTTESALVNCDPLQVRAMLGFILENAVFYSADGATVTVSTGNTADGCRVAISDSGCGIDYQILPHIGLPFVSARSGTAGMGLAIAAGLAFRNNARIAVATGQSGGTMVTVTFLSTVQSEGKEINGSNSDR